MTPLQARSPTRLRLFRLYLHWYFWRRFHAVRVALDGMPHPPAGRPLVVFSNHPSWWDPALFLLISEKFFPGRPGFAPMAQPELEKYGLFKRMGAFGIEPGTARGAARFLRICVAGLADPRAILWITAEGRFVDPRARPLHLQPGIAHLARRVQGAVFLPLAIEYNFWNESRPEALLRFGRPLEADRELSVMQWTERLQAELAHAMDGLTALSIARRPADFRTVLQGSAGVGGVYDLARRARAALAGRRFDASHGGEPR